ncbi:S8 family serine peptidase, partial [bacterium]|nr:S8 family serine peptidase [bacterium]
ICSCGSRSAPSEEVTKAVDDCEGQALSSHKIIKWKDGRITKLHSSHFQKKSLEDFLKKNKNKIQFIENDFKISKPAPNSFSLLRFREDAPINWGVQAISAPALWKKNILGENIKVAVVDSGIDSQHPQLTHQLSVNPNEPVNGIDDDGNGLVDDVYGYDFTNSSGDIYDSSGHGSHVSGIIAADHSAGPVLGVAPKAKLLVYVLFSPDGGGSVFDAIAGIRAAQNRGAKIINASWGGPGCSRSLREEIESLAQKDILFVSAAGNEGLNIDRNPMYPAAYNLDNQISVAALTYDGFTMGQSNFGRKVHIIAPGVDIESTVPGPLLTKKLSGTSMATPFVVGSAALLWSAFPNATAKQIKDAMISSVKAGPYPVLARGSLDVAAAHAALEKIMSSR